VRNLLVGLLWLSVLVSLSVYGFRLYRRLTRGSKATRDVAESATRTTASNAVGTDLDRVLDHAARAASPTPAPTPRPPARDRMGPAGAGEAEEAGSTVAEVLTGVALPCDLVPIVDAGAIMNPYRVAFSTHSAPASDVGVAVGDELERLGFSVRSVTSNQLEASKGGDRLTVTIHAEPGHVTVADAPAFPTLPPGSVVVEFEV
jgi:hypothetical protein